MNMQQQFQPQRSSKGLYITLAILLTIQALPFVGLFLNMIYIYAIVGVIIGIITLVYTQYDDRKKIGAILAIIAFLMAIFSGTFFTIYLNDSFTTDGVTTLYVLWMMINWGVVIVAMIFSYIEAFKRQQSVAVESGRTQPFHEQVNAPVEIGFQQGKNTPAQKKKSSEVKITNVHEKSMSPIANTREMKFQQPQALKEITKTKIVNDDFPLPEVDIHVETQEKVLENKKAEETTLKLTTYTVEEDVLPTIESGVEDKEKDVNK